MRRIGILAALAASHSIHPASEEVDFYDPDGDFGVGDAEDYDPELEDLLDESYDEDDHMGGPGDGLLRRIEKLQRKEAQVLAQINSSTGGKRKRAINRLARIRKSLGRRRSKLSARLAKNVAKGKLSNADATRMSAAARMPWEPMDDGFEAGPSGMLPSGTPGTSLTRPMGAPAGTVSPQFTQQPGPVMSQQNQQPLANGATIWGGAGGEPIHVNTAPVQVVHTTELVKAPGTETPLFMNKAGETTEWIDASWVIGTGGRVEWKAELPLRSYAEFEIIGATVEPVVIGRAADTALAGTIEEIKVDGGNSLLMDKRSFSFVEGVTTTIDSLRNTGRIPANTKVTASGYVEQLGSNAAALSTKFRIALLCRVTADRR